LSIADLQISTERKYYRLVFALFYAKWIDKKEIYGIINVKLRDVPADNIKKELSP
jgi:hypothetical protein